MIHACQILIAAILLSAGAFDNLLGSIIITNPGGPTRPEDPIAPLAIVFRSDSEFVPDGGEAPFGYITLGTEAEKTCMVFGGADLRLSGDPRIQITGPDAADFTIVGDVSETGGNFILRFRPEGAGPRKAQLVIRSNNPSVFAANITGYGAVNARRPQNLVFTAPTTALQDQLCGLHVTASSGLPVFIRAVYGASFERTDEGVIPRGTGLLQLEAFQPGNAFYLPAKSVIRTINVIAPPSSLTLTKLYRVYDGSPQPIAWINGPERVWIWYETGPGSNEYDLDPPRDAGVYKIRVESSNLSKVLKTGTLTIVKAPLRVLAHDQRRLPGSPTSELTYSYQGFLGDDSEADSITNPPKVSVKITASSPAGFYPITLSGGVSRNYEFLYQPGWMEVESLAGSYEALLIDPETALPAAKLQFTVAATSRSFTSRLITPTEITPVSFKGPINYDPATRSAAVEVLGKRGSNLYRIAFNVPQVGDFNASATFNSTLLGASSNGKKALILTKGQKFANAGRYTAILDASAYQDSLQPAGTGWATGTINAKGALTLLGKLGDGTPFTTTLSADSDSPPGYHLFIQPYKPNRTASFLGGKFGLSSQPYPESLPFDDAATLHWIKAGLPKDSSYRAGFNSVETRLILCAWQPQNGLASLRQTLGLDTETEEFLVRHSFFESSSFPGLPTSLNLAGSGNTIIFSNSRPNPTQWKMSINRTTGSFTGGFEILNAGKKCKVPFSGIFLQSLWVAGAEDLMGCGQFLLNPQTGITGDQTLTGTLQFTRQE